jgi:hypothetical protein
MYAILNGAVPPLVDRRPDVPPGLEQAIRRCLERDVARRFANVAELAEAIASFGSEMQRPLVARITQTFHPGHAPFRVTPGPERGPYPQTANSWGNASGGAPQRSSKMFSVVIAGTLVGLVAVVAVVLGAALIRRPNSNPGLLGSASAPPAASVIRAPSESPPAAPRYPSLELVSPAPEVASSTPAREPPAPGPPDASTKPRRASTPQARPAVAAPPPAPKTVAPAAPAPPTAVDQIPDNSRR